MTLLHEPTTVTAAEYLVRERASDHFVLASIGCTLALEDIYEKVMLDQPQSQSMNGQSHRE